MASQDPPYDPYIPAGGAAGGAPNAQGAPGNQRTAALQAVSTYLSCKLGFRRPAMDSEPGRWISSNSEITDHDVRRTTSSVLLPRATIAMRDP